MDNKKIIDKNLENVSGGYRMENFKHFCFSEQEYNILADDGFIVDGRLKSADLKNAISDLELHGCKNLSEELFGITLDINDFKEEYVDFSVKVEV